MSGISPAPSLSLEIEEKSYEKRHQYHEDVAMPGTVHWILRDIIYLMPISWDKLYPPLMPNADIHFFLT